MRPTIRSRMGRRDGYVRQQNDTSPSCELGQVCTYENMEKEGIDGDPDTGEATSASQKEIKRSIASHGLSFPVRQGTVVDGGGILHVCVCMCVHQ